MILRCRLAGALMLLAGAACGWVAGRGADGVPRAVWLAAAMIISLAGWLVWLRRPAMIRAARRSMATMGLMFCLMLAMPLETVSGEPAPPAARLAYFVPLILWAFAIAGLLWGLPPPALEVAEPRPVSRGPSGASKRKKRKRRQKT